MQLLAIGDHHAAAAALHEPLPFELAQYARDRLAAETELAGDLRLGQLDRGGALFVGLAQQSCTTRSNS